MEETLMSGEFSKFTLPLIVAIITWGLNEWRKRAWEQYQRKEEKYKDLVRCSRGFYAPSTEAEKTAAEKIKAEFVEQLSQCWLYCPDEVIKKAYDYLWTEHDDYHEESPREEAESEAGRNG
jgi:Pyruvate/2-oxoacid:ferredoxin oxidoreductase delta subunit